MASQVGLEHAILDMPARRTSSRRASASVCQY